MYTLCSNNTYLLPWKSINMLPMASLVTWWWRFAPPGSWPTWPINQLSFLIIFFRKKKINVLIFISHFCHGTLTSLFCLQHVFLWKSHPCMFLILNETFLMDSQICSYVEVSKTLFYWNIIISLTHDPPYHFSQFFLFWFYKQNWIVSFYSY